MWLTVDASHLSLVFFSQRKCFRRQCFSWFCYHRSYLSQDTIFIRFVTIIKFVLYNCNFYRTAVIHGGLSHEWNIRLSVKCVNRDKTNETCAHVLKAHEITFTLVFWQEEWLVGASPCTWIFFLNFAASTQRLPWVTCVELWSAPLQLSCNCCLVLGFVHWQIVAYLRSNKTACNWSTRLRWWW